MATNPAAVVPHPVVAGLVAAVGAQHVLLGDADRTFYAEDVYASGTPPLAVVRPGTVEELAHVVRTATQAGVAVVPRSGGMSYTDGYLSTRTESVTIDLARLDRVIEINAADRYVTVECGIAWKALHDALAPLGVRTPYWGPLSGLRSLVGGALGIKARATLRLIAAPAATEHVSWAYDDSNSLFAGMADVGRADLASECFAFDPGLQKQRMKRTSLVEDAKSLGKVMMAAGGALAGLKEGAKVVMAGRSFLDDVRYSLHLSFDGRDSADAAARAALARKLLAAHDGREVENSIPKVMRANPFAEVNSMLGPNGERWVPVHGTVPFSGAQALFEAVEAVFARHANECERLDIDHGYLACVLGDRGILVEPVFYWPDERQAFHERVLDADYLAKLPKHPQNLVARRAVAQMRGEIADVLAARGAISFQIGKFYRYQSGLEPSAAGLLAALKRQLDPAGLMNPGSLGLSDRTA